MPPFDPPEILEADLSPLLLDCALWGVGDPASLQWLDPPPKTAIDEARTRLAEIGAIEADGRPTAHGRSIARLPLPPRLAHMLVTSSANGFIGLAAEVAMLLSERGLGGNDTDIERRLYRWRKERGQRAETARGMAKRWAKLVEPKAQTVMDGSVASAIALAFPDRIAKRRDASGENWLSVGGRGYRIDPAHPLAKEEWLAVAGIQGAASGARILSAAAIDFAEIEALYGDRIVSGAHISFDPATGGVRTESGRRLGAITLSKGQDAKADPEAIAAALLEGVREYGLGLLPWSDASIRLRERAQWAGVAGLSDAELVDALEMWLAPLLGGKRRLSELDPGALHNALLGLLGWENQQIVERLAPPHFTSPAGTTHAIDYSAEGGPLVELRVQALFGLAEHPVIGTERTPLVLSLTSPAGRPIQTTRDLSGFWRGSWADVAKEMRGRYPKHNWPDDPTAAVASLKTKKAQSRT
jgi:ATP-dependent helicase HrpB